MCSKGINMTNRLVKSSHSYANRYIARFVRLIPIFKSFKAESYYVEVKWISCKESKLNSLCKLSHRASIRLWPLRPCVYYRFLPSLCQTCQTSHDSRDRDTLVCFHFWLESAGRRFLLEIGTRIQEQGSLSSLSSIGTPQYIHSVLDGTGRTGF